MRERSAHYCSMSCSPFPHTSGTLDLNLSAMPEPASSASSCSLDMLPEEAGEGEKQREVKLVDLFKKKRMKGWWPVYSQEEGARELAVSGEEEKGACSERQLGEGLCGDTYFIDGSRYESLVSLVSPNDSFCCHGNTIPVYLKTVLDL